jgi:hypothetical protein
MDSGGGDVAIEPHNHAVLTHTLATYRNDGTETIDHFRVSQSSKLIQS